MFLAAVQLATAGRWPAAPGSTADPY